MSHAESAIKALLEEGKLKNCHPSRLEILQAISDEVTRAKELHSGKFNSLHEAHSVAQEEFEELWDEIKMKKPDLKKVKEEAIQVAAMMLRLVDELC